MKYSLSITALVVALGTAASAQAPAAPPTGPPAAPPRQAPRPANSSALALAVQVTDKSGNGIGDVAVSVTGPVDRSGNTAADGTVTFRSIRGGTYRLRFQHERYITLERDVVVAPRATEVSVALNPAPVEKPTVAVTPPPPVQQAPTTPQRRAVEPRVLSILDFLDKNLIGSEPQKTSLLACTDGGTARILQVKEPLNNQQNPDADQVIYVVAGSGIVRVRDQDYKASAGWFALVPRGVSMSARRDGRTPLIALTVAMGAACADGAPLAR